MNPVRGILLGLIGYSIVAFVHIAGKILSDILSPVEIGFWRNIMALPWLLLGLFFFKKFALLKTTRPFMQLLRASLGTLGLVFAMWAVSILPVAVLMALGFTAPLFVVLLSIPILGEKIGIWRLGATIIGFIGVLIIVNPFSEHTDIPLDGFLIALVFVLCNAAVTILLRVLGKTESSMTTVFYFLALGAFYTGGILLFTETASYSVMIAGIYPWIIIGLGVAGILSLIAKTEAYVHAEASLVSPTSYIMIVWGGIFDWFLWHEAPTFSLILGAAIIILANFIILWREKVKKGDLPASSMS